LIRERAGENWSEKAVNRLLGYAIGHPDPEPGKLNVRRADRASDEATVDDLVQNSFNCIRGIAGEAIEALLWEHPEWLVRLRPGLDHLVKDVHPAVRIAALKACLPVLNTNRDLAVELFLTACNEDLRVAACRYAVHYFNCCMQSHAGNLLPIVVQMLNSDIDEVAEKGAKEVTARWLFFGLFEEEIERCKTGSAEHRKGIASVASHFIIKQEFTEKWQKARNTFYNKVELLKLSGIQPFVQSFIRSQAFRDDPTGILFSFENYPDSLIPFADSVFTICKEFTDHLAELSRDFSQGLAHDVSKVLPLLLRLYEQLKDNLPEIMNRCLDAWDILFENRIGHTREMTKIIEQ